MAAPKKYKLDLFDKLLPALDKRDFDIYSKLSDEEKKGFADIVAVRAMSSAKTNDRVKLEYFIAAANGANKHLWNPALKDHKELKCMMLASAGIGSKVDHEYIKTQPIRKINAKIEEALRRYYPTASINELLMFIDMNDVDALIELGEMVGLQKEPLRDYKKEIKKAKK